MKVIMILISMIFLTQCSKNLDPNPFTTVLRVVVESGR